jgi:hypothetical protein
MDREIKAIKNTISSVKKISTSTDRALEQLKILDSEIQAQSQRIFQDWTTGATDQDEYNRQMDELADRQRREGNLIEETYLKLTRNTG